jgi:hypothetical protein
MYIREALKQKNLLIQDINELMSLIEENNSIIVGNKRLFKISELLEEVDSKILELSNLKTKIQKANIQIYSKIFLISELKLKISSLKRISTRSGIQAASYGSQVQELEVELNQKDVRNLIKESENKIINLQQEIEEYNSITEI